MRRFSTSGYSLSTVGAQIIGPAILLSLVFTGCGSHKRETSASQNTSNGALGSAVASDSETSTALVSAQLDEASTALSTGDSSSNAAAALVGTAAPITRARSCTPDTSGKGALVSITYSGSATATIGKASISETGGGSETRDWTSTAGNVVCTTDNKYAKIAWKSSNAVGTAAGIDGLTLAVTTTRSKTLTMTYVNKKGVTLTRNAVTAENGTRTINWSKNASGTATTTTTKTINSLVAKTYNLTRFNGTTVNLDGTHATLSGSPLVITTTRDATGLPLTHTVVSGTMTLIKVNGFYLTNKYDQVVFTLNGVDPCTPTAGTITTNIYASNSAADTATPLKTMSISFSASGPNVAGDATATDNFIGSINHKCDLRDGD